MLWLCLAFPDLAERETLEVLAHWAYHYGSPVVANLIDLSEAKRKPRARLWLEAGASLKLFGGLKALAANLHDELALLGHEAKFGLAPTRAGAALLAEASRKPRACFDSESLAQTLARVPIAALPWPGPTLSALRGVGLRKLGELFDLPRESFARRFGEDLLLDLDRLRGDAPEPFIAIIPPPRYARRFEFSGEVETVEPLLFPLKRMCAELAAYLRARDNGAVAITLACAHALGEKTRLEFRFLAPTRDAARMFAALNERLLRDPPDRPVREITLEADQFATPQPLQGDLLDALGGRTLDWQQALERLQARFGEHALWTPACIADHRPEYAFARATPAATSITTPARRPIWLLKEPQPMSSLQIDSDCERIESGWWDADAARDYYRVERNGGRAWVFQDRRTGLWFLHGWFG